MERLLGFGWVMLAALALGAGCGDSDSGNRFGDGGGQVLDDDAGSDTMPAPVAVTITAENGGEIASGGATVAIPAGALSEDTEITIAVVDKAGLPDASNIASDVFNLGPDGTTFAEPVRLTLEFDPSATPDGMVGTVAYLDGDTWTPLADSRVSGDTATATTDHFTYFAVVWAEGGTQTVGACTESMLCGAGSIVGTWDVSVGCITLPPNLLGDPNDPQNPFAGCEGITSEGSIDITGTVTFGSDMSYETDLTFAIDIRNMVPTSCVPQGATCADLGGTEEGAACVIGMPSTSTEMAMGTYALGEGTFTTTDSEGKTSEPLDYCATPTMLVVRSPGSDTSPEITYVATKQ